jgi:hypothetical protein
MPKQNCMGFWEQSISHSCSVRGSSVVWQYALRTLSFRGNCLCPESRRRFRYAPTSNNQRMNLLPACHRVYLTTVNYEQCSALYRSIRIRVLYVPQLNHVVGGLLLLYAPTHQPCSWWPPTTPAKLHYYLILVIAPYPCFLSWISKNVLEKYQKLLFMGMWCTTWQV